MNSFSISGVLTHKPLSISVRLFWPNRNNRNDKTIICLGADVVSGRK